MKVEEIFKHCPDFQYEGSYQNCSGCHSVKECPKGSKLLIESKDPVNNPEHYTSGGIECIDAIKACMSHEEFIGFLKGNIIKYLWRYRLKKKPVEDLKKSKWYLDRLIRVTELEEAKPDDMRK